MEKQINQILTQIHENDTSKLDGSFLDKYYQLFDTKKYLGKDFDSIYKDMETAYDIKKYSMPYDDKSTKIYKQLVESVVNVFDDKKRLKLIPLIVYLDIENTLYNYLYENKYFDNFIEVKDYFIGTLEDSGVSVDIKSISKYHWESEAYESYQKALVQKDFIQIYNFVEAVQRGNFMYEPYIDFLSFVSVKIFFDDFVKVLDNINNVFKIKYLLNNLTTKEKLLLANKTKNTLVKFEAIRSSVYFKSNHNSCSNLLKDENGLISKNMLFLTQDKQVWKDFLQYFLIYPSRNPQLFLPLADVLSQSSNETINIFIDTVKINQYFDEDSKEALNNSIFKIEDDEIQKYIMEKIFTKWKDFIDSYDDYIGNLFLTDVIDIAIVYVREFLPKEVIEKEIKQIIYNIEEIDNYWFKNSSQQGNYLYKQLSKLFVFGISIEKHHLNNLKNEIGNFLYNIRKNLRGEYSHNSKTTMQLFNEYVLKENK
ncbi:hypothetical protein [Candidatus Marinarcus aquaticus]|uniref:Uncharacterized protein n=1 Tax=Candidatus Marinarcus aquaticus TaxID=2044504 RepID=A0A4Q0XM39_9BACT|nr:hypothetical protein [Candidatus Marinarcus aquaticus]RXJ54137.1 hypothetical protein CRV04_12205 [Candidatus Marinarcus aquaticus]